MIRFNKFKIYKITLPDDFNSKTYKSLYCDLVNLSDEELKDHYIKYGFYEKREYKITLPNDLLIAQLFLKP